MKKSLAFLALCALLLLFAAPAATAEPLFSVSTTTGDTLGNAPIVLGFQFTTNTSITVTALGFFDDGQDGLVESHEIGLWDGGGNLLASTSVNAGTINPLTNQFRYGTILPVTLAAEQTYDIGTLFLSGNDGFLGAIPYTASSDTFSKV